MRNKVLIIPVLIEDHPNSDNLGIVRVSDEMQLVINKDLWKDKNIGAWVPPGAILQEEDKIKKIKTKKIRGVLSHGILLPAPQIFNIGDDATEFFGVKWETDSLEKNDEIEDVTSPVLSSPNKYPFFIDSWENNENEIFSGTDIVLLEKEHGTVVGFFWENNKLWIEKENEVVEAGMEYKETWIEDFCLKYQNLKLYGVIKTDTNQFCSFDVYDNNKNCFLNFNQFFDIVTEKGRYKNRIVPIIAHGNYDPTFVFNHLKKENPILIRPKQELYKNGKRLIFQKFSN